MKSAQRRRFALVALAASAIVGVPGALAAAGVTNWHLVVVAAIAASVAGGIAQLFWGWIGQPPQPHGELAEATIEGFLFDSNGKLPRVRDISDPIRLGVHPTASRGEPSTNKRGTERITPYILRDIDNELRRQLQSGGFIIVTGDSTAGKSRTAYEAMRATVPDHLLLMPANREALPTALSRMLRESRCIWLDDVERFLGSGGLTRTGITQILAPRGHGRIILGTMRAAELARYVDDLATADNVDRQVVREIRETLEQAEIMTIARLATSTERIRAETFRNDPRIAAALAHADIYGLAEYLAAGPALLRIWEASWEPGQSPRNAAIVAAAIDCRRAGLTRPVPRVLLNELHDSYLRRRGGDRLRPESLVDARERATQIRLATTALLERVAGDCFRVFDYLVDVVQRRATSDDLIPTQVLTQALAYADPADAQTIGRVAYDQGQYTISFQAFTQAHEILRAAHGADHLETLGSRLGIARALHYMGRYREAESILRAIVALCQNHYGDEHPQTQYAHVFLGDVLADSGNPDQAVAEYECALGAGGQDAELLLLAREGLGASLLYAGHNTEAEAVLHSAYTDSNMTLGPDHVRTVVLRCYHALVLEHLDRLGESEAEQRSALNSFLRILGPEHLYTLQSRSNLGGVLRKLGRLEEAEKELVVVLQARLRTLGTEHPGTIEGHEYLADVRMELGKLTDAEADYRLLCDSYSRTLGPDDHSSLQIRRKLADVLVKLSLTTEAEEVYSLLLQDQERILGDTDPETTITRQEIEHIRGIR